MYLSTGNVYLQELNDSPWQAHKAEHWRSVFEGCPQKTVRAGGIIYGQGEIQEFVYLLVKGRVTVSILDKNGDVRSCMVYTPGTLFGSSTSIEQAPSLLVAQADTTCHFLYMHRDIFLNKVIHDPNLSLQFILNLSNTIRALTQQIKNSTFKSASYRVINYLIQLATIFGEETELGKKINFKFTHQQIADLIGTTRVTVSRIMGNLGKAGILQKIEGYHYIKDEEALKKYLQKSEY